MTPRDKVMLLSDHGRRRGQTIVFLLMALTILMFALLWNIDLHRLVAGKSHAQNAGDSAALAAARWQGESLNLIGELVYVLSLCSVYVYRYVRVSRCANEFFQLFHTHHDLRTVAVSESLCTVWGLHDRR